MKNNIRSLLVALGLGALAPFAMAGPLTVTIAGQVCHDGDACDLNPVADQVTVIAGVSSGIALPAGFALTVGTSFSKDTAAGGLLDLTWSLSTTTGGHLDIIAFQDGYTHPGAGPANLVSTITGDMENGTLSAQQFLVDSGGTHTPGAQGPFSGPTIADVKTLGLLLAGAYSLEEDLHFDLGADTTTTGDFKSRVLPEPATVALLGLALVGLVVSRRKA